MLASSLRATTRSSACARSARRTPTCSSGREAQVAELVRRLRNTRFLAVVGASGSGKSSLVLAGLLPALERGTPNGAESSWRVATMRPGAAPIEALATVLARTQVLGEQSDDPGLPRARS